ncbi:hypothetical protein EI982_13925 [Haloplanus rallus]|jgi:hypothetical protein|uniref:Uncharacterized protein n=1 Tax=Haloplanus rallus TaxID=1816183 RepID=A0A6B9FH29_9EURY|nr:MULTISPECIES: hypothetical protein [Haloplanus]QGX95803.1 hypothetical protein EI982_13925 [Haloplanus rallus]
MSGERGPSAPAGTGTDGDAGSDGGSDGDADADEAGVLGSWSRTEMVFAVLLVVAVAGTAALFVAPGGDTTTADTDDGGAAAVTVTATPTPSSTGSTSPNVTMRVRSVESCGSRCRTVTIGLSNEGTDTARDVRVATRITTGDRLVWEGSSDVGRLDAGETVTRTRTVRVGYADAVRIKANDGRIRIETTVRTANATRTFTERRTVA